jgi:hypothetical protein
MQIYGTANQRAFVLGGRAVFTVVNPETGGRYTYKVSKKKSKYRTGHVFEVRVLTRSDNTKDYARLGMIFPKADHGPALRYRPLRKSRIGWDAPSAQAFTWIWSNLRRFRPIAPAEFLHEGHCGACGRPLTVPESIRLGLGPRCAERILGLRAGAQPLGRVLRADGATPPRPRSWT